MDNAEALAARERLRQRAEASAKRRQQQREEEEEEEEAKAKAKAESVQRGETAEKKRKQDMSKPPLRTPQAAAASTGRAGSLTAEPRAGEGGAADALAGLGVRMARQDDMEQLLDRRLQADASRREAVIKADRARTRLEVRHMCALRVVSLVGKKGSQWCSV